MCSIEKNEKYTPIDCNYYDQLEAWSVLKQHLILVYKDAEDIEHSQEIKIADLQTKDKVEYLITNKGLKIRLDHVVSLQKKDNE